MADVFDELEEVPDSLGEEVGEALASAILQINESNNRLVRQMVEILSASGESERTASLFQQAVTEINNSNKQMILAVAKLVQDRADADTVFHVVRDEAGFMSDIIMSKRR